MNIKIRHYLQFMQWFRNYYPRLHDAFWENIGFPIKESIQLSAGNMTASEIEQVKEVIKKYHRLKRNN